MKLTWRMPITALCALGRVIRRLLGWESILVPSHVAAERRNLCENGCRHYKEGQCRVCCCFIAAKVFVASEECPDEPPRWKRL